MPDYPPISIAQAAQLASSAYSPESLALGDGDHNENRRTLERELRNTKDPRIAAVLQRQLDVENGAPYAASPASASMRDGFPEVSGGAPMPAARAARVAAAADPLDDYLASLGYGGSSAGKSSSGAAAHAPAVRSSYQDLDDYLANMPEYKAPPPEQGNMMRGAKVALGQTMPLVKGVVGLLGASAEQAFGEGGLATGVKNWGLQGYQAGMDKLQPLAKDTDELTTAWDKAKAGDLGALVDWAQYGLGYSVAQGGEAILTSILGGAIGTAMGGGAASAVTGPAGAITGLIAKGAVKEAAQSLIQKAVIKEANKVMLEGAGKITADEAVATATKSIAKEIGSNGAMLAYGTGQELGSIYPEAEAQSIKDGKGTMGGADLARVWGAGLAAGGIEALTDKLGVDAAFGKLKIPGVQSRIGQGLALGGAGALTEGVTEGVQTAIEHYGQNQPIADAEGLKDIINSAGMGAIGGTAMGGGAGLLHGGRRGDPAAVAKSNQAMDEIATAQDADSAIDAFSRTHIPIEVPKNFDAEGAMARMERANANDENMLRDRVGDSASAVGSAPSEIPAAVAAAMGTAPAGNIATPEGPTVGGGGPTVGPTVGPNETPAGQRQTDLSGFPPTAPERIQAGVPETFQDRLAVVREKLDDSRTRQQLRDNSGSQALGDALYFAKTADDDTLPGKTSDAMLRHAERLLNDAGVPDLPRQVQAQAKVQTLVEKRAAAQAKIDEENKTKETVAPGKLKQELDAARAAPGMGLKERAAASSERQKAALLTGNAKVAEEGLLEPLPGKPIDEAAHAAAPSPKNELPEPTQAQKEAGNYAKGHLRIAGLDISVENPEGSTRSGVSADGKPWSNTLKHHYGYIRGTVGGDGEHIDAFIKPGTTDAHAGPVFVVDQQHVGKDGRRTGQFDEHKALIGFETIDEAKAAYRANYHADWNGMATISTTPMEGFKQWLSTGDTSKPFRTPSIAESAQALKEQNGANPSATTEATTNTSGNITTQKPESTGINATATPEKGAESEVIHKPEQAPAVADSATPFELGATVKHTTGKGKEIFGHILQGATDAEARAIDPFTFKKDGGYFIREKHADELTAFEQQRPAPTTEAASPAPPVAATRDDDKINLRKRVSVLESLRKCLG